MIIDRAELVKRIQSDWDSGRIKRNNITQSLNKIDKNYVKSVEYHTEQYNCSTFKERFYFILNDLNKRPNCKICGKEIDVKFRTIAYGFGDKCKACSRKIGHEKVKKLVTIYKRNSCYDNVVEKMSDENEILTTKEEYLQTGRISFRHLTCNKIYTRKKAFQNGCPYCSKIGTSKQEKEIVDFIASLGFKPILNTKPLKDDSQPGNKGNLEIDIIIPEKNIGIEFDGIYYHSELSGNKDKNYHINKTKRAEEIGLRLIHIFENEWQQKKDIVKSVLRSKLGKIENRIYARKCVVKEISTAEKKKFLENNHLQGNDRSLIKLGLFYEDELVSVMTFGRRKITGKTTSELLRFCNKINTTVIGGASKLYAYFTKNHWDGEDIISYANLRYSDGNLYDKLNFRFLHDSPPSYFYFKNDLNLLHRSGFMKHMLNNKVKFFDSSLTEWENMQNNGFDRIWDCGTAVYIKESKTKGEM